jgi:hypothetical protein
MRRVMDAPLRIFAFSDLSNSLLPQLPKSVSQFDLPGAVPLTLSP